MNAVDLLLEEAQLPTQREVPRRERPGASRLLDEIIAIGQGPDSLYWFLNHALLGPGQAFKRRVTTS